MKKRSLSGVLVLLTFAVFMVSVLLVLLSGADTVQKLTRRDQRAYHHRTAVQYLTTKVRQHDVSGAVTVQERDGISTLVLTEEIDGCRYETRIYCYEGYLREMFCVSGAALPATFGEQVLPMEDLQATRDGDTVSVRLSRNDGSTENILLHLRSEGGATE